MENINWIKIQNFYDEGNTVDLTSKEFKISTRQLYKAAKLGLLSFRKNGETLKLTNLKFNRKYNHTEETKRKISEIRKNYLLENPDKVPYLLNHSSKESYPEKYFSELFEKENIKVEKSFRIGLYQLDFCILNKKIDIEVDGNQHYLDDKIVGSDVKRNEYLESNGWDIIRIKWSDYKKMGFSEKTEYIKKLKDYINTLIDEKPSIILKRKEEKIKKDKKINKQKIIKEFICSSCGCECSYGNNICSSCYRRQVDRKVERPPYDQLIKEVENNGYSATGRKYGVSDRSIKKWIKFYEKYENVDIIKINSPFKNGNRYNR